MRVAWILAAILAHAGWCRVTNNAAALKEYIQRRAANRQDRGWL